jgi:hypothetical protein
MKRLRYVKFTVSYTSLTTRRALYDAEESLPFPFSFTLLSQLPLSLFIIFRLFIPNPCNSPSSSHLGEKEINGGLIRLPFQPRWTQSPRRTSAPGYTLGGA